MQQLAHAAQSPGNVYFAGGVTAVMHGFRLSTMDIDLKFSPEPQGVFEAIPNLKETLSLNIELASPVDFIPVQPDWEARSVHIATFGQVSFYHFDYCAQALAKLSRLRQHDLKDVACMLDADLISYTDLEHTLFALEPLLLRYPDIDKNSFYNKIESAIALLKSRQT